MSGKIPLSALLLIISVSCIGLPVNPDNNNILHADVQLDDSSHSCSRDESIKDDAENVCSAIEMKFSDREILRLSGLIPSEKAFKAYSERKKQQIVAEYPEFQRLLQAIDQIDSKLTVVQKTTELYRKRLIVKLAPIAMDALTQELREDNIPYVRCRLHDTSASFFHRREINQILRKRRERRERAAQQEAPSLADRIFNWARERLHPE